MKATKRDSGWVSPFKASPPLPQPKTSADRIDTANGQVIRRGAEHTDRARGGKR